MVFEDKKIPKHLIIREEYEIRRKPRFGAFKLLCLMILVGCITWALSNGVIQL